MKQHVKVPFALATLASACISSNALAHGFMDFPKARQAVCEAQGGYWWPQDGTNIPNLGCRAAFLESGYVQFTQEHEFSVNTGDYNNQSAVEANIPNGSLCAAGDKQKRGMDIPSSEWQKTIVTPNADGQLQVRWLATTPHNPSFWKFYLTKPTFNPATDVLTWQDLELVTELGNVDFVKDPDGKRYYNMTIDIPKGRSGDAILYTRWQRIDVVGEGFYNCSDIQINQDSTPVSWHAAGYFVTAGQTAKTGDKVWARVFDANGQELVSQSLSVTDSNAQTWQQELANVLNAQFSQHVKVGVQDASGDIVFDSVNVLSNQVYVTSKDNTYNLTVQVATPNTPPVVHQPDPLVLDEGTKSTLHVHAFDDEQTNLSYRWSVPAPLTFTGSGATIELSAGSVEKDTAVTLTVTVSDGELETSRDISVTVKNVELTVPAWSASKVYWGKDRVSYQGKVYEAKWWTQGETPGKALVWKAL